MKKHISGAVLLCVVVVISFWLRILSVEGLPTGQFTETDAYFYYWQASLISEHGHLPARDMSRWLPAGRDLGQTLNLYGYVLAYTHKAAMWVFPNLTLYHITLYMPPLCFCIALAALCLFLYHTYGLMFSITAGLILATLPGSIERSTIGFGDRDAFCLMTGTLSVVTYLVSLQAETSRRRFLWTLVSGFTIFIGGISWEGFGVFLSVIIVVELWRFLSAEEEKGLRFYLLWVLCFVPTLYLASPAYRNGYGFAEHLFSFVLMPSVVLLGLRTVRYVILSSVEKLRIHARALALGLTLASAGLALVYIFIQRHTFTNTTVPLSQSALMQAMTELQNPTYMYWVYRYGWIFILGSIGFIVLTLSYWKHRSCFLLAIALTGFSLFTFFREQADSFFGEFICNVLFGLTLAGCTAGFLWLAYQQQTREKKDISLIACVAWFILWVALARDAKRYDFFIGVSLAFGTAALIETITVTLSEKLRRWYVPDAFRRGFTPLQFKTGCAVSLLILLMGLPVTYTHTYRAYIIAKYMRAVTPSAKVTDAMEWMKSHLSSTTVVAAPWKYGSQLNVIAGVKTITDQDTYIPHWIDLYYRHVIYAENEHEALVFLKSHNATHLMLVGEHPAKEFLQGKHSDAFLPLYPKENFYEASVNVWELLYPPDIKTDVKFLKTGFPEIDVHLQQQ